MFKNKNILVTGGTGMIGRYLVEELVNLGAHVHVVSMDSPSLCHEKATFESLDLTEKSNCIKVCKDMDMVFNLVGIKGSPLMAKTKPVSFFEPTILFSLNMLHAAHACGVERYLYTSSVGVYHPSEIFMEDDVWKTFPSENDRFPGWAKRIGELQVEAYKIQYEWKNIAIVRPANVYGNGDNFDPKNAMVIPSIINRAMSGENPLTIWGDGSVIRDFIHAKDVAKGMLLVMEKMPDYPVNLGSGTGYSIKELVEVIVNNMRIKPDIEWDISKPSGDKLRIMDISRAERLGFSLSVSLDNGIKEVMEWYGKNGIQDGRHNVFYSCMARKPPLPVGEDELTLE